MLPFQANVAQLYFETPALDPETFQVVDFKGEERISQPFQFDITLVSEDPDVAFADVVNQSATLKVLRGGEEVPIYGLVCDFRQSGHTVDRYGYRAVLVPRMWQLTLNFQSRIFQEKTVEEIVTEVLEGVGLSSGTDFRFALQGSYPTREYCVQYQENDLNFISRLLEHEGIQFFFEHTDTDVLVMTDDRGENPPIPGEDTIPFNVGGGLVPDSEAVRAFSCRERIVTGKVVLKDYNYRTPETDLKSESQVNGEMPGVHYEYGQHFKDQGEGDRLAQVRNEEIECRRRVLYGSSDCRALRPGHVFGVSGHYRSDLNGQYMITEVQHAASQGSSIPGLSLLEAKIPLYRNEFTCIPADVPYRPPRSAPVPHISGIMTSRTETAGGPYAYLDDQGRYRLKMHFDIGDLSGGTATRAIRKAQPYSGPGYGIHFPEHADTEMVWACVDGDPDRPMALLTAPNPSQASPSTSGNAPQNVIRTWGQNELTFDDTQGAENIYLHATKDRNTEVTNDHNETVGNNQTMSVGVDRTRDVGNDEKVTIGNDKKKDIGNNEAITVGNNQSIDVGNNRDKTVGTDQTESIGSNKTIDVGANHTETIGADKTLDVGSNHTESIGSNMAITVGSNLTETVTSNYAETVGVSMELTIGSMFVTSVGANSTETVGGNKSVAVGGDLAEAVSGNHTEQVTKDYSLKAKTVTIVADDQITLKTGKASITMKKDGVIVIEGKDITAKGSGEINVKATKNLVLKGKKILEN